MPVHLIKLLLVEDSPEDSELLLRHLKKADINSESKRIETRSDLVSALNEKDWDAVICDYNLPQFNALEAIAVIRGMKPELPCIVVSGSVGEERAVETMRAGASDYIMKNNLARFVPVLQRELKEAKLRNSRKQIEDALKESEENLRQAQKLESIGQLAGGIAHDFNNLLAIILLQSEVLIEGLDETLSSSQLIKHAEKAGEQIKKSGERATNLTRQLLAFSRKQILQPKVLNLNALIFDIEKMLSRIIEANIEFKTNLSPDLKNIKIDPGHLEQILVNLVVNSRDAMPNGGHLKIETQSTYVDELTAKRFNVQPGSYVSLTVTDSGIGMAEEVKRHLFEPFFTTKPVGKGTGLGLCTVYGIVKQNKGLIFVESEIGKGTCFKISFPTTDEELQSAKEPSKETEAVQGTETLLVVEDEADLRELICETLKSNGYKVLMASNGMEAIEHLKTDSAAIHLVITDVIMPLMSGPEIARQAQSINTKTRFLFQSGYAEDILLQSGLNTGQIHFLAKPYSLKTLLKEVKKILS